VHLCVVASHAWSVGQSVLDVQPVPVSTGPVSVGPVSFGPVSVGLVSVEPVSVGPVSVGPASVEPVSGEPVSVEPVSCLAVSVVASRPGLGPSGPESVPDSGPGMSTVAFPPQAEPRANEATRARRAKAEDKRMVSYYRVLL
jgi:hypothetical protein